MSKRGTPPSSARVLTKRVDAYARERGVAPKRVRDWISYMILGGHLEGQGTDAVGPRFILKGAVAMEMRLSAQGRATKDIDLIVDKVEGEELVTALRTGLEGEHQGFSFRVKGEPHTMPNDTIRIGVVLAYRGRSWGTVQVDLSRAKRGETEVDLVDPLDLEPFGLETPPALPCLSLRYQVAQKIHAMTKPTIEPARANERFRDLVDLLLLKELAPDLAGIRTACVKVFEDRGTHEWPPDLDPPSFWEEPFRALAQEVRLPGGSLEDAVREARTFIRQVEAAR